MLYLFLMHFDPTRERNPDNPSSPKQHNELEQALRSEKKFLGFAGLMPPEYGGTRLQVKGGAVTDGPFPETKELLAGVYLMECRDADDAAEQAKRIPVESRAWVEVRQVGYFRADPERAASVESPLM